MIAVALATLMLSSWPTEPPADHKTVISLVGGFGAPTGMFGLAIGHEFDYGLALEVGGGLGVSGAQAAALMRAYPPLGGWKLTLTRFGGQVSQAARATSDL